MSWKKAGGINRSSIQQAANIPYLSSNYESNFEYVWANDVSINSTLFVGRSVGINAEPVKITQPPSLLETNLLSVGGNIIQYGTDFQIDNSNNRISNDPEKRRALVHGTREDGNKDAIIMNYQFDYPGGAQINEPYLNGPVEVSGNVVHKGNYEVDGNFDCSCGNISVFCEGNYFQANNIYFDYGAYFEYLKMEKGISVPDYYKNFDKKALLHGYPIDVNTQLDELVINKDKNYLSGVRIIGGRIEKEIVLEANEINIPKMGKVIPAINIPDGYIFADRISCREIDASSIVVNKEINSLDVSYIYVANSGEVGYGNSKQVDGRFSWDTSGNTRIKDDLYIGFNGNFSSSIYFGDPIKNSVGDIHGLNGAYGNNGITERSYGNNMGNTLASEIIIYKYQYPDNVPMEGVDRVRQFAGQIRFDTYDVSQNYQSGPYGSQGYNTDDWARMLIASSGNVGIGHFDGSNNIPETLLDVSGATVCFQVNDSSGSVVLRDSVLHLEGRFGTYVSDVSYNDNFNLNRKEYVIFSNLATTNDGGDNFIDGARLYAENKDMNAIGASTSEVNAGDLVLEIQNYNDSTSYQDSSGQNFIIRSVDISNTSIDTYDFKNLATFTSQGRVNINSNNQPTNTLDVNGNVSIGENTLVEAPNDGLYVEGQTLVRISPNDISSNYILGVGGDSYFECNVDISGNERVEYLLSVGANVIIGNNLYESLTENNRPYNGLLVEGQTGIGWNTDNLFHFETNDNIILGVKGDSFLNGKVMIGNNDISFNSLNVNDVSGVGIGTGIEGSAPENGMLVEGQVGIGYTSDTIGTNQLAVKGKTYIFDTLEVDKDVSFNASLEVKNSSFFGTTTPVEINNTGRLLVKNKNQSTAVTNGSLIVHGGVGIAKNVFIGGNLDVAGSLNLLGNVDINGDVVLNGKLTVTDETTLEDKLVVMNDASFNENVVIDGMLSCSGTGTGLEVTNDAEIMGVLMCTNDSTDYPGLSVSNNAIISGNLNVTDISANFIEADEITVSGTTTSNKFNATSDYRIKEDIKELDETYSVDNLRPVSFKNKLSGKNDIGLIAHEMQSIYDFLVSGEKDGESLQTINYNGIIGILIKEIQELKKENQKIKTLLQQF